MERKQIGLVALLVGSLGAALGCGGAVEPGAEPLGTAIAQITLAPLDAKCAVIQVAGTTTVTKQFNLAPDSNTVFTLSGLPLGMDTFTATAFNVACAQIGTAMPNWISDPVVLTVTADAPVNVTFSMRPAGQMGQGTVGLDFQPSIHGVITEFHLATPNVILTNIGTGPDGNLWFGEDFAGRIGRITTAGAITELTFSNNGVSVSDTPTAGPDGNVWFTDLGTNIVRITPGGVATLFPTPTTNSGTIGITTGADGNLWFTEASANKIGRINTAGIVTEFPIPTANSAPSGIAAGADGNLWFVERSGNRVGRITPAGSVAEFTIPTANAHADNITAGPDGNLWFAEEAGRIGRVTTSGSMVEFAIPGGTGEAIGICAGPDGNVWFTDFDNNAIGRITPTGVISEFLIPTSSSGPASIVGGSDGNLWFTEEFGDQIGRLTP